MTCDGCKGAIERILNRGVPDDYVSVLAIAEEKKLYVESEKEGLQD